MSRLIDFLTMFRYFTFPYLYGFFLTLLTYLWLKESVIRNIGG